MIRMVRFSITGSTLSSGNASATSGNCSATCSQPTYRRPLSKARLQSAVEASECTRTHQRHEQNATSECEHVRVLPQVKAPDATDEQIGEGKVGTMLARNAPTRESSRRISWGKPGWFGRTSSRSRSIIDYDKDRT